MALNAELEVWHGDSECRKPWMNGGSECQMKHDMALNAKRRCGFERQTETKHGSECQTKTNNYERQAKEDDSKRNRWEDIVALNVELRNDQRLWTPKWNNDTSERRNETMALKSKPKETSMNANLKQKLCILD